MIPSTQLARSPRVFFFKDTATTEIYTLSLHDALPIFPRRQVPAVEPEVRLLLERWRWPGNVRELRNVAQYAAAMAGRTVRLGDLPASVRGPAPARPDVAIGTDLPIRTDLPYLESRR